MNAFFHCFFLEKNSSFHHPIRSNLSLFYPIFLFIVLFLFMAVCLCCSIKSWYCHNDAVATRLIRWSAFRHFISRSEAKLTNLSMLPSKDIYRETFENKYSISSFEKENVIAFLHINFNVYCLHDFEWLKKLNGNWTIYFYVPLISPRNFS